VGQTITSTTRLVVRQFVDDDASFLHDLHSRPEVFKPLEMEPSSEAAEELLRIRRFRDRFGLTGGLGIWALALLDGPPVGLVMLKPLRPLADHDGMEVGWRLHPDFWGNGYGTEGASGLLQLAFSDRCVAVRGAVDRLRGCTPSERQLSIPGHLHGRCQQCTLAAPQSQVLFRD